STKSMGWRWGRRRRISGTPSGSCAPSSRTAISSGMRVLGGGFGALREQPHDEVRQGVDRVELAGHAVVLDGHAPALLDAHHELQRFDAVESEALLALAGPEERHGVADGRRRDLELQALHDQLLESVLD